MPNLTFADLGLSPAILAAIEKKGFTKPSPIQAGVIPLLLTGDKDIIGQAQTGTGKTAAFALPMLERLDASKKQTQAIVLVPTRELAIQVAKEIGSFGVPNSPTVAVIYGGNNMRGEITTLRRQPTIVVGTPGRIQHHIRNRDLRLDHIQYFVLDEADEMLNFGFRDEIEEILKLTPPQRRVLLFSATMPLSIMNIVKNYMKQHDTVKTAAKEMTNEDITQKYYCMRPSDKFEALCRIMENEESFYAIIFCRTKIETDLIASQLNAKHLRASAIHGDIDQSQRERILIRFRERKINILVATDVAARGIDIPELNFVVNYGLPENYEAYTHRIGRTGRAGRKGTAITLIAGSEVSRIRFFERNLKVTMEKGVLPTPQDLIAKKQQHLIERLEHIVNNENIEHLLPLAEQLLEEGKPAAVVATLLKDFYQSDFDPQSHRVIVDDLEKPGHRGGGSTGRPWRLDRGRSAGGNRAGGGYKRLGGGSFSRGKSDFSKRKEGFRKRK
jgi:ATP-dependent RNA helicase DeaD